MGASEQQVSFRSGDSWCRTNTVDLRSGSRLIVSTLAFEPSFGFSTVQAPAELDLSISRGAVVKTRTADGHEAPRAGTALRLGRVRQPVPIQVCADGAQYTECVSVSMTAARLSELLGAPELPAAFRAVTQSTDAYPLVSESMTPQLFRVLEEIANADVRGRARPLWLEAKSLELVALMADELAEAEQSRRPLMSAHDLERFERVRRRLVERLDEPPTLAELARAGGFNETKLKGGFRALFGTSVFAYLRRARMEEARRLLRERRLNVTEVAGRVGYSNPSKFAAAFRRELGVSPSEL